MKGVPLPGGIEGLYIPRAAAGLVTLGRGRYTRGGMFFSYGIIILSGVVFLVIGISKIVGAFRS